MYLQFNPNNCETPSLSLSYNVLLSKLHLSMYNFPSYKNAKCYSKYTLSFELTLDTSDREQGSRGMPC